MATLNQLDEAIQSGKGSRVMREILANLIAYTEVHFETEEKLMQDAGYPLLSQHQAQHRQLIQKVGTLRSKFENSGRRITKEMMDFLKYWLTNHILVDDAKFGSFYQA